MLIESLLFARHYKGLYIRETASSTSIYPHTKQTEVYGKVKLLEITLEAPSVQVLVWNRPCEC